MTHAFHVSDRAVIRYLELVYGFDVDFFRNRIDELTKAGIENGSTGVKVEGVNFVLRYGRVTDVIEHHRRSYNRPVASRDAAKLRQVLEELQPTDPELAKLMLRRPGEGEAI
jgi:hypothetical protein